MTREEAIKILVKLREHYGKEGIFEAEALNMAIKALENIGHLTNRPCDVCEFHGENGCSQWT